MEKITMRSLLVLIVGPFAEVAARSHLSNALGLLVFALLLLAPSGANAQRIYRCVDDKGVLHMEEGVLPAWCASQYAPVTSSAPPTAKEIEETRRFMERQIVSETAREERCRVGQERIEEIKEDGLDAIDLQSDDRKRGRFTRGDARAARQINKSAASAQARLQSCIGETQARAAELRIALADPGKTAATVPEWRAEQQRMERERVGQLKVAQERQVAAARAAEERRLTDETTKRVAAEAEAEAQRRALARREAEADRARALRRDLGVILDEIAATSRSVIAASESARADLLQMEKDVDILQRRHGAALRAPEYREPVAALVEGVLALRAAGAAVEKEAQLAAALAERTTRLQAVKGRMGSGGGTLVDRANLDTLAREADASRAEHEKAARVLAERRGSLVRVVERTTQMSASLQ